jgi:4-hydroxythreonine-4-phosphate dehydrogenase
MHRIHKPIMAITMGDPAGIGPEIVARVASQNMNELNARLICIGDRRVMEKAYASIGQPAHLHSISSVSAAFFEPGCLDILDLENVDCETLPFGKVSAQAGQAAYEYITTGIDLAMAGQVDAVVTSAINKEALHLAGHKFDGHTEIFASRTGSKKVTMMLASGEFRVTHVTTHCSLQRAIEQCRTDRILDVLNLTNTGLRQMDIASPRLAVTGLNPHSGEGGIFGNEEIEQIQPAIEMAIGAGLDVYPWPVPADTVFVRMSENREFDAVVAMYHDQGHIAAKLIDFWGGVNITLGLPIIRTSVDHGTAFDIAYTNRANPKSLINAIEYAIRMTHQKM